MSNMIRVSQKAGKVPNVSGISTIILLNKLKEINRKTTYMHTIGTFESVEQGRGDIIM